MKRNMGKTDKTIRLILGIIIAALGVIYNCYLGLIGVVLIITAFINFCPLYWPFGLSTRKKEEG